MAKQHAKLVEVPPVEASAQTATLAEQITDELISCRAYEKWQQRGCPLWDDGQDWFLARAELEQERGVSSESRPTRAAEPAA